MLTACGSAAPTGSTPPSGTLAPSASRTSPAVTTPTATAPETSQQPGPSFAGDPVLAAAFPKQVAGQPVTSVTTALFIDFLRAFDVSQADLDLMRQNFATIGIDLDKVIMGSANATVSGSVVGIQAYRIAGQDANKWIQNYALISPLETGETLSKETSGGKNVSVVRDAAGDASTWIYANGEIVWSVETSDPEQAAAVFTALP